jgi:hypothetical protein
MRTEGNASAAAATSCSMVVGGAGLAGSIHLQAGRLPAIAVEATTSQLPPRLHCSLVRQSKHSCNCLLFSVVGTRLAPWAQPQATVLQLHSLQAPANNHHRLHEALQKKQSVGIIPPLHRNCRSMVVCLLQK